MEASLPNPFSWTGIQLNFARCFSIFIKLGHECSIPLSPYLRNFIFTSHTAHDQTKSKGNFCRSLVICTEFWAIQLNVINDILRFMFSVLIYTQHTACWWIWHYNHWLIFWERMVKCYMQRPCILYTVPVDRLLLKHYHMVVCASRSSFLYDNLLCSSHTQWSHFQLSWFYQLLSSSYNYNMSLINVLWKGLTFI